MYIPNVIHTLHKIFGDDEPITPFFFRPFPHETNIKVIFVKSKYLLI
jgi:hypothetical protein